MCGRQLCVGVWPVWWACCMRRVCCLFWWAILAMVLEWGRRRGLQLPLPPVPYSLYFLLSLQTISTQRSPPVFSMGLGRAELDKKEKGGGRDTPGPASYPAAAIESIGKQVWVSARPCLCQVTARPRPTSPARERRRLRCWACSSRPPPATTSLLLYCALVAVLPPPPQHTQPCNCWVCYS